MNYHDVLAELGIGSAHPGGMESTLEWMNQIQLKPSDKVLDVGCGTGRTACLIAEKFGCDVIGVDVRPVMIDQAHRRKELQGITNVRFLTADAEHLDFDDNAFQCVLTESVNVFLNYKKALIEYHRVLSGVGTYVDVEMCAFHPLESDDLREIRELYGAETVPTLSQWKQAYKEAGFSNIRILRMQPLSALGWDLDARYPDPVFLQKPDVWTNREARSILQRNGEWMAKQSKRMAFLIAASTKPSGA